MKTPQEIKIKSFMGSSCTHNVSDIEKGVLNAMVNGGKPVYNTSCNLKAGWLTFKDDKYHFTDRIINEISELSN